MLDWFFLLTYFCVFLCMFSSVLCDYWQKTASINTTFSVFAPQGQINAPIGVKWTEGKKF